MFIQASVYCKIRCHAAIFDLPAKAAQLNVKQYNGYFGCLMCYHPGQYINGNMVYPFEKVIISNLPYNKDI